MVEFAKTAVEHLSSSCLRFEARRVVLEFGHEHLSWPPADDVSDELYDAAEALAERVIRKAIEGLPADHPWQPILTAPMDGTMVDLWFPEQGRMVDCYFGAQRVWERKEWSGRPGSRHTLTRCYTARPTHWMPRPDQPGTSATVDDEVAAGA